MYEYLSGRLHSRKPARVVLDVGGVGFELFIPLSTYSALPQRDAAATVLVHYHQREDGPRLFGFATHPERALFRTLITISGIGPALAIQILSAISIKRFYDAVEAADDKFLTRIKGIGKKTAQRLIVELAGKLPDLATGDPNTPELELEGEAGLRFDARVALETLGVAPDKAEQAITRALAELGTTPESADVLVRAALRFA